MCPCSVTKLCQILCDPMNCIPPGSSVRGIFQARILEGVAISFSSKRLLISCLQLQSAVILEPKKLKSATVSTFSPSVCHKVIGPDVIIFVFWMLSFKLAYSLSSFTSSRGFLVPLCFLPLKWYHLHIWGCWYFSQQSWFQLVSHPAQHFAWCTRHREDFPVAQTVKNLPVMQETWVQSLGQEDPLGKGKGILAWRTPMDKGAWPATVHGVSKSRTQLSNLAHTHTYTYTHT